MFFYPITQTNDQQNILRYKSWLIIDDSLLWWNETNIFLEMLTLAAILIDGSMSPATSRR